VSSAEADSGLLVAHSALACGANECHRSAALRQSAALRNWPSTTPFINVEIFLTQPLEIIAGSKAGSRWMSEDVYKRAASKDKNLHIAEGASDVGLYDEAALVAEAMSKLAPFFRKNLTKQKVTSPATA
jgi:fermentation-respiration switch protein FrsA (DUF1100 family)